MDGSFAPATRADWLALVEGVLKGAPYGKRMVTRTPDGLVLDALPERRPDARPVAGRPAGAPWRVVARIDHADAAMANAQLLDDLAGAADGFSLVFASSASAYGFGLPETAETVARVLDGVRLDLVTMRIEAGGFRGRDLAFLLADLVAARGLDPSDLDIRFGIDPIGDLAATGAAPVPVEDLMARASDTVATLRSRGFGSPLLHADGRLHHAAGATDAQEIAAILATGVGYLRALEAGGLAIEDAAGAIETTVTADTDQFATIAKLRALRLAWARLVGVCGIDTPPALQLHAETAWRSLARYDPHLNLLRGTVAAFAAGVGGADSLTVLPFTQALGLPDGFARRLARNTQLILIEESNIHRVADPGAGAGAIEERTEQLAAAGWELFRAIEARGGMAHVLLDGWWAAQLAEARDRRAAAVATRREAIVGVSEFPLLGEAAADVLAPMPARATPPPGALPSVRLAEPFERLRAAAEATRPRPRLFLANLGAPATFAARAGFAKGLYEAGGIEAIGNDGFAALDELVEAFKNSAATLACLCGADESYERQAAAAAAALKDAGVRRIDLAGRAGNQEAALRAAGVDGFVFSGCDALAALRAAHRAAGVTDDG